jgi:organic hydroperoxide reductase OsmC/OhrA
MDKNEAEKLAMTAIHLHPEITFRGDCLPTAGQIAAMHEQAHHQCFLASQS